jgi:hypothetical protein
MPRIDSATGVVVTLTTAVALAPTAAFAVDYMSADEAAKLMFPQADRFEVRTLTLDAAQLQQLQAAGVAPRSARWQVRVAQRDGTTLGYVVVDDVIGKFELISYAGSAATARSVRWRCCRTARATATRSGCRRGASSSSARMRRRRCASATTSPTSAAPR